MIKREKYLEDIRPFYDEDLIKVITGIRRCGKSFLLDPIFKEYLINSGVKKDHIIKLDLDDIKNIKYIDPYELDKYIDKHIIDDEIHYVLID